LDSLYAFFQEARDIMRKFPVGRIDTLQRNHLGVMICDAIANALRPFLEKWQVDYRHWWEHQSNPRFAPVKRQSEYPRLQDFLADWSGLRWLMRELMKELVQVYELVEVRQA
ncbi:MAG: hypothetical protein ACREIL_07795, partial [Nitrospiraceae bacterium]